MVRTIWYTSIRRTKARVKTNQMVALGIYGEKKLKALQRVGFGQFSGMTFVGAEKSRLRTAMDYILWLFTVSNFSSRHVSCENP